MLYARAITLRNCGRFTVVASDFGSDYRTHTHVTSEALYAGLTRGATWRPRLIDLQDDPDAFTAAYDVMKLPIWFLPGLFIAEGRHHLSDVHLDATAFNVVSEFYPSTSRSYRFKRTRLEERNRPYYVPTYGTIQAIKPHRRLVTYAFSPRRKLLERFTERQTFLLGKKRTMVQIVRLSEVTEGEIKFGCCNTGWYLELPPDSGRLFGNFEVLAATMRYLVIRGMTREATDYIEFPFSGTDICLPDFYLKQIPLSL